MRKGLIPGFFTKIKIPHLVFFVALFLLLALPIFTDSRFSLITTLFRSFFLLSLFFLERSFHPKHARLIHVLLVLTFINAWLNFAGIRTGEFLNFFLTVIMQLIALRFVIMGMAQGKEVTLNTLFSALSGYILLGLVFALLIFIIEVTNPGNFNQQKLTYFDAEYLAFVTMSTLGYGDITPVTGAGRSILIITTLFGQFYMVTVLGIIVSKFTVSSDFFE